MGFLTEYANKSGLQKHQTGPKVSPGGSYGNPSLSSRASITRLVEAFRSQSPGGWSDDRWEQSKHLTGITYICFPSGTRVRMSDGSYKSIENVRLRDEVLTAEGNVHRVTHCFVNKHDGDLIKLNLWGHRHLKMTPNHEVLTKRGYIPAELLTSEDWVAIPRYMPTRVSVLQTQEHVDGETKRVRTRANVSKLMHSTNGNSWGGHRKVPDFIDLTPEFGRILGLFLAEGWTHKNGTISWSFGAAKEKDTLVPELVGLLEKYGFNPHVGIPKSNPSVIIVSVCGKLWVRLFDSLCGKGAGNKRLHPDVLAGPNDFLKAILEGWLAGDGHCGRRGGYTGATVSHDLALNMFDIGNVLGMRPNILTAKPQNSPILKQKMGVHRPVWKVGFASGSDNYRVKMEDTHLWRKVEFVERVPYSGDVFNIEVATDQSYVAEGIGVHNCAHRICEQMSQAEFQVFIRDPSHPQGKREVTEKDKPQSRKLADLGITPWDIVSLLERPNDDDSFGDLMYKWGQQLLLTGMGLTWMLPNELGTPMQLFSIPTAIAIPQPTINPEFPHGFYRIQPVYPYGPFSSYPTPASAVGAPIPAQWMLKFKFPHPFLHYDGYSPLTALRLHIDEVEMVDRSRFYSMKRSVHPSAVLNFDEVDGQQPLPEPEIARIHTEWENEFQGPENHGKIVVGTPGGKIEPWGSSPVDMEYASGWEQLTSFVMAGLGITKPVAGMIDGSSYSTLFAALKQFHLLTLKPMLDRIASKLTRQLGKFFGDSIIIEIRCPRIDDHELKRSNVSVLAQYKALTLGEMREALDFPRTGEEWENERAGEEPQQQGMPGMPGMDPNAMQPGMDPNAMMQQQAPEPGQENIDDILGWSPGSGQEQQQAQPQQMQPAAQAQPQQQTQPAQASQPQAQPKAEVDDVLGWSPEGEDGEEVDPSEASRPSTGGLGAGALGPRKSLHHNRIKNLRVIKKSIYQQIREAIHVNGQA